MLDVTRTYSIAEVTAARLRAKALVARLHADVDARIARTRRNTRIALVAACVVVALLLLASCGSGSAPDPGPVSTANVYLSPYSPTWPGSLGYTEVVDGVAYVHVRQDIDPQVIDWWVVVAHELWHVAGHHYHLEPPCVAASDAVNADDGPPCPEELAAMALVPGPIVLYCETAIYDATALAAFYWNDALGRELFSVRFQGR